jgi:hypothetical protein
VRDRSLHRGFWRLQNAEELGSIERGLEGTADRKVHPCFRVFPPGGYALLRSRSAIGQAETYTNRKSTLPAIYAHDSFNLGLPPQPERDCIPPRERHDRQTWPGYWIFYNRDGSVSFGTETREYFGLLPAEIVRAVSESVINCIACTVFEAHRTGRSRYDRRSGSFQN